MHLAMLLLATVSATSLGSPKHLSEELVARTSCGDHLSISKCLLEDIDLGRLDEIKHCYVAGGCSKEDATTGAVWFAHEYRAEVRQEAERIDLKRRADSSDTKSDSAAKSTTEKKTSEKTSSESAAAETTDSAAATSSSSAAASTSSPSSASASTTSDSSVSDSTQSSSTIGSTLSSTTSSNTMATTSSVTSNSGITSGTACSTTTTKQTSICSTVDGKKTSCTATEMSIASCAPNTLCTTDSASNAICMKLDNSIGIPGIIIAVVFGTAILAVLGGIIIMNAKSNRAAKRREAESQALLGAYTGKKGKGKSATVGGHAPQTSEANLPLISEPGASGNGEQGFVDNGRRAPQLHQGLGALA